MSTITNLVSNEEEEPVDQDTPDSNVGENASPDPTRIDRDSSIPIESNKIPCQWSRNNWDVDESWVRVMAEVKGGQVEEVEDQDDLSPNEVRADK